MTPEQTPRIRNLTISGLMALTGCVTIVVIAIALFMGLWVDSLLGRRGPATICFLVSSVPLSLYLMMRMALTLIKYIKLPAPTRRQQQAKFFDEKEE